MTDGYGHKYCMADGYWIGFSSTCKGMFKHVDYNLMWNQNRREYSNTITVRLPGYAVCDFCRLLWWIFVDSLGFLVVTLFRCRF